MNSVEKGQKYLGGDDFAAGLHVEVSTSNLFVYKPITYETFCIVPMPLMPLIKSRTMTFAIAALPYLTLPCHYEHAFNKWGLLKCVIGGHFRLIYKPYCLVLWSAIISRLWRRRRNHCGRGSHATFRDFRKVDDFFIPVSTCCSWW